MAFVEETFATKLEFWRPLKPSEQIFSRIDLLGSLGLASLEDMNFFITALNMNITELLR